MSKNLTIFDLQAALDNNEFELFYQPKTSMITGEISGAEALIRWRKEGELIPPFKFIPLAEESNFIRKITKFVFKQLIIDLTCINSVSDSIVVSFNASGRDFHNDELTETIVSSIKNNLIQPDKFEIEVTETVLAQGDHTKKRLNQLSDLGISIAMDDFGTGHSGLAELSQWPFSILKIDQHFIKGLKESDKNREIVKVSIRMAHQLSMDVVAEGIEDEETYKVLQEFGCMTGQGYWMSKPLALQDFILYIRNYKNLPAMPIGLIYMAQLDHMQWRKTIIDTAYFLHRSKDKRSITNLRGSPTLEHTSCSLGKWYYGQGSIFKDLIYYRSLKKPHIELHEIGNNLIKAARDGCPMEELIMLIQCLSEKSIQVIEILQKLENHLYVNNQTSELMVDTQNLVHR